jgi:hypothetical protein
MSTTATESLADWGASVDTEGNETQYLGDVGPAPETESIGLDEVCARETGTAEDVDWLEAYHRHGGDPATIASATGEPEAVVRERLVETVLHSSLHLEQGTLGRMLPHEIEGLSPLGCGECGATVIAVHPCPECGFDPRGATDA